jgi:type III polyketide synthase
MLSRAVPKYTVAACDQMFQNLFSSIRTQTASNNLSIADFDWALHPGGQAIVDGVQEAMCLTDQQLRATREIYRSRGNSSSPTVLAVLDRLRYMSPEKKFVVATAFGPGLSIEMSVLRPCALGSSHAM